jgi:hypothetical protein
VCGAAAGWGHRPHTYLGPRPTKIGMLVITLLDFPMFSDLCLWLHPRAGIFSETEGVCPPFEVYWLGIGEKLESVKYNLLAILSFSIFNIEHLLKCLSNCLMVKQLLNC